MERLTSTQKQYLLDVNPDGLWTECFPSEARTTKALLKRGLIEVNGDYEVRLTMHGSAARNTLRPKFSCGRDPQTAEEWDVLAKFFHVESGEAFKAQIALADEILAEIIAEEKAAKA